MDQNDPFSHNTAAPDIMDFVTQSAPPKPAATASSVPTILVTDWHRSHLLDFFREKNIEFHPDYSWKTFIWLIAKFIVNGREEEIVETDWKKMAGGGTAMFIKFSTIPAFDEGVEILRSSKAFEGCLVERIRG
ncbi:hypothetical protein L873DRAFT_1811531 [Choiromyces venosus 120613-1]|uniref:Uncharacterized protein n=1 Tax=Choiromyces venosus 120613-1 TaxID=1336337 RepID=A0A3N4JDL5_9PEZI|nr:hypothetical protein L873DRAFT_1811531 [Choiromyces venosus 120613-1]